MLGVGVQMFPGTLFLLAAIQHHDIPSRPHPTAALGDPYTRSSSRLLFFSSARPPASPCVPFLQALAASSALGFRSALSLAVPRLLRARKEAAAAAAAMERQLAALEGASAGVGCCGGGGGEGAGGAASGGGGGGGCCGGGAGGGGQAATASSFADKEALGDAQAARLGALAGLTAAVDDKVRGRPWTHLARVKTKHWLHTAPALYLCTTRSFIFGSGV